LKIQYLSSDEILHEAKNLYSRWDSLTFEEKRKIVETIVEKIVIGEDEVTIHLCYIPSPPPKIVTTSQHNLRGSWPPPG